MKKIIQVIAVAALALMTAVGARGQQCILSVVPNAATTTDVEGLVNTVKIDPASLVIQGSGKGWTTNSAAPGYNAAVKSGMTGDITVIGKQTSLWIGSQSAVSESGAILRDARQTVFVVSAYYSQGTWYVKFEQAYPTHSGTSVITVIGNQPLGSTYVPIWVKVSRSGGTTFSGSYSTDGTNYHPLGSMSWGGIEPYAAGLYAFSGDTTTLARATYSSISINGQTPGFTDVDTGVGFPAGDGQPDFYMTFSNTISGSLSFTNNEACSSNQLNAIALAEQRGSYFLQYENKIYDSANVYIDEIGNGQLVCATCSEPAFSISQTAATMFLDKVVSQDAYVGLVPDSTFINTLSAANVALGVGIVTTTYADGHPAVTHSKNQGSRSPDGYYVGPTPNYQCSTTSAPPDYRPVYVASIPPPTEYAPFYVGVNYCKRPKGSPSGTLWTCEIIIGTGTPQLPGGTPFYLPLPTVIPFFPCTNLDKGILDKWPPLMP